MRYLEQFGQNDEERYTTKDFHCCRGQPANFVTQIRCPLSIKQRRLLTDHVIFTFNNVISKNIIHSFCYIGIYASEHKILHRENRNIALYPVTSENCIEIEICRERCGLLGPTTCCRASIMHDVRLKAKTVRKKRNNR